MVESIEEIKDFLTVRLRLRLEGLLHENEVQANKLGGMILGCTAFALAIVLMCTVAGVFPLSKETIYPPTIMGIIESAILVGICSYVKYDRWWVKLLLVFGMCILYARLDGMLTHKAAILMVIPVVFSSRYFSRRLTNVTSVFVPVLFLISAAWGAVHGMIDLNIVTMPEGTEMVATGGFLGDTIKNAGVSSEMLIKNTLLYDYFPKWLLFSIVAIISSEYAGRGREMIETKQEMDMESAKLESEMTLANRIQDNMLPNIFPAFPNRTEFDIYASMTPAKEVGGDFYDFFLVDDDHLCLEIADVSGKGVPAALFMMASKIIMANNSAMGKSPARVLADTNAAICANNRAEMFVTSWIAVLEISTGKVTAANAGHEYPMIKNASGKFEILKDKHGFVVGGVEGVKYKEYELQLEPGDKIFVYTDGVPEAMDADKNMFGIDRMLETLNENLDETPEQILTGVKVAVDKFVKGAEQFDDLTMLCLEYKGK